MLKLGLLALLGVCALVEPNGNPNASSSLEAIRLVKSRLQQLKGKTEAVELIQRDGSVDTLSGISAMSSFLGLFLFSVFHLSKSAYDHDNGVKIDEPIAADLTLRQLFPSLNNEKISKRIDVSRKDFGDPIVFKEQFVDAAVRDGVNFFDAEHLYAKLERGTPSKTIERLRQKYSENLDVLNGVISDLGLDVGVQM